MSNDYYAKKAAEIVQEGAKRGFQVYRQAKQDPERLPEGANRGCQPDETEPGMVSTNRRCAVKFLHPVGPDTTFEIGYNDSIGCWYASLPAVDNLQKSDDLERLTDALVIYFRERLNKAYADLKPDCSMASKEVLNL